MTLNSNIDTFSATLPGGFVIRSLPQDEFQPLWDQHYPTVFANKVRLDVRSFLSKTELEQMDRLSALLGPPLS